MVHLLLELSRNCGSLLPTLCRGTDQGRPFSLSCTIPDGQTRLLQQPDEGIRLSGQNPGQYESPASGQTRLKLGYQGAQDPARYVGNNHVESAVSPVNGALPEPDLAFDAV
jgi:hypothetical protein